MVRDWILAQRPFGVREYREPFVGGGGIFFGLNSTACEKRWINDKHSGLIEVYKALRDRPDEFIAACKAIPIAHESDPLTEEGPRGGKPTNARLKKTFEELCLNQECDQALRYYFVNRTVHGSGRVNYDIPSRLYFSNPDGWGITATDRLTHAAEHLTGTEITCGDYADLFDAPGENVWIYADPPYVVNTNLTASSQLYQHGFTQEDHRRFAEVVARCQHKVCISYDDDGAGLIRSLYPEDRYRIVTATWKYAGTTNAVKADGKELLILNYDPPSTTVAVPESVQIGAPLSEIERAELEEYELAIHQHFRSFVDAGRALRAIRDSGKPSQRLYREEFQTFKEYVERRWGVSEGYATRMICGFVKCEALKTLPIGKVLPERESHVRQLLRIESDSDAATVWQAAVESVDDPSKITAKTLKEFVDEHLGVVPPEKDFVKELTRLWEKCDPVSRERFLEFISKGDSDVGNEKSSVA